MSVQFSVIIPVYNCASYLRECVDSVLVQSVQSFEILLIDDGSTDESGALCDELQGRHSVVRAFHKRNGGAADARNYGIERAAGAYLLFLDGDDTLSPDCLSQLLPLLTDPRCLPVFGLAFDYWQGGVIVRSELKSAGFDGTYPIAQIAEHLQDFFQDNVLSSACNKVFSASILQAHKLRFSEGITLYEDFVFVLSYLRHVDSIVCLPQPLYHYRNLIDSDHVSRRVQDPDQLRKNLRCLNLALKDFGDSRGAPVQAASVSANLYLMLLTQHLLSVRYSESRLRRLLPDFCGEASFQDALACKPALTPDHQALLTEIKQKRFRRIQRQFRYKRLKRSLRKRVKKILHR